MARYTIEVSSMLSAFVRLLNVYDNPREVIIKSAEYNCKRSPLDKFDVADFDFYQNASPNGIINKYGAKFIRSACPNIIQNFTDQNDLNTEIMDQFLKTFVRHFYGYEIGQENPLYWWNLMQAYLDEYMPFFVLSYQQLIIQNQSFITGINDSETKTNSTGNMTGNGTNSGMNATADTPQKELNFKLDTGDPAKDYNFGYSTVVNGAKGVSTSNTDSKNNSDSNSHSQGRNQTIMSLINQLNMFSNGLYLEMFQNAKNFGLFMQVLA